MKFKFKKSGKKKGVVVNDTEPFSVSTEKTAPVKKATFEVVEEEPKKELKKKEVPTPKKSKLDGLSPSQKAKVPFSELDPKDPIENKEIIRRRNMGFN